MATAIADGHSVMGRAGDGAGGQVDAELVLGEAVGVAYRRHLGAHVMAPLGLLVQGGPVGVGRIPVNLKVFRLRTTIRAGTRVGVSASSVGSGFGVGGGLVGAGFVQKFVDDVAISGVGRRDGHVGDQLVVGIDIHVGLVPIEGPGARLVPVTGLHIDGGDQPIPGHLAGDTKHPSSPASTSWPATNPSSSAAGASGPSSWWPSNASSAAWAPRTSASTSASRAFGSSQSHGGLPRVA